MHSTVLDFLSKMLADPGRVPFTPKLVLEIGSFDINGGCRHLFTTADQFIGIDVQPGAGVDVVANGVSYDPPFAPDLVVTTETFEHAPDVRGILVNVARMLRPGGVLLATAATNPRPQHSGVTGNFGDLEPGEFYRNVDCAQLHGWLTELFGESYVEVDRSIGDVRAWARKAG